MEKLTGRDYNILAEIDRNPKVSFHQIGKKLRLSPSVVERRIKNLINKGVIREFQAIINYKKLGYTYYSVYARFQNQNELKRKKILNYLKEHPLSGQVLLCDGRWQLVYGFFARDVFQLNEELKKVDALFYNYFKDAEKVIHIGSHHYYRGYLPGGEGVRKDEPFLGGPEPFEKIDEESRKILNSLRGGARRNIVELSKELGISLDKFRYRLKSLREKKILLGSWVHLNPEKLGLQFYRLLLKLKSLSREKEKALLYFLNKHPHVIRANHIFGSWNFLIDLEINAPAFREFMNAFMKHFSEDVLEYETIIVYDEVKFVFSPLFS